MHPFIFPLALLGIAIASSKKPRRRDRERQIMGAFASAYDEAARLMGRNPPPLLADASVSNAESDGNDVRFNPLWVRRTLIRHCDDATCSHGVLLGISAHELAHHFLHSEWDYLSDPQRCELQADFWAGRALARGGYDSSDLENVLDDLADHTGSREGTHPPGWKRREAIRAGHRMG